MSKFLTNIDLNKNQTLNRVSQNLASVPSLPVKGLEYFDTTSNVNFIYNGTAWIPTDARAATNIPMTALTVDPTQRVNHTGTQLATTISDFTATVRTNPLNTLATPVANVAMGGFTLTGLNTGPSASGQAAEYSWVVAQIQASAAGIDSKPSVVALSNSNIASLSGLATTVDGVSLSTANMRVLLTGQTTASQNGPWLVQSNSWIRPPNEMVTPQSFYFVEMGTVYAGSQWKIATSGTITLDTTPLVINQFGASNVYSAGSGLFLNGQVFSILLPANSGLSVSGSGLTIDPTIVSRKFSSTIGDGSSTSIAVVHNLNTQDITLSLRDASTNVSYMTDWTSTNSTTVTLFFSMAPTSNSLRVTVIG